MTSLFFQLLMYADDVKLYSDIKSSIDSGMLQSDIKVLIDWCSKNGFSLNGRKCSVMSFHRCRNPIISQYYLQNFPLPKVTLIKDLGILLDSKLSFIPQYDISYVQKHAKCWVL